MCWSGSKTRGAAIRRASTHCCAHTWRNSRRRSPGETAGDVERGYKFWFYEADLAEPARVHIGKGGREAKFWLEPLKLARAGRFRSVDLREIERIIDGNLNFLLSTWQR